MAADAYVAGFVARCAAGPRDGRRLVDEPGVHGLLASADHPRVRLLVSDDRAHDVVHALLSDTRAGTITVLAAARRCAKLVDADPAWTSTGTVTAMVRADLLAVPAVALPDGLTLRPVRRVDGDASDGVALEDAVGAAARADPRIDGPLATFAGMLRSMPAAVGLFAAVDGDGVVRATSGYRAFGEDATVFFVNTDPAWRRRRIGQAMTAVAVRAARDAGARRASLDATETGVAVYGRLGFQPAGRATRFVAAG